MRISHGTYRGIIALVSICGTFMLAAFNLWQYGDMDIAPWVVGLTSTIIAFYFGERAAVVASRHNGNDHGSTASERAAENVEKDKQ